jgi:enolase
MSFLVLIALALSALSVGSAAMAGPSTNSAAPKTTEPTKDAETCPVMMQGSGTTKEGRKAMQEFMQSPKGAQAMTNMMEMARRMGNGEPMLGMTKMMEMMAGHGDMGGMMGGQAGPKTPESK